MKINQTIGAALLFGAVLLTSCETCETSTITPVTEEDTSWLAYTQPVPAGGKPDTIRFTNEANGVTKFIRTQYYTSNVPGEGYSFEDKCIEQLDTQASAVIQDVARKMPGLATYILKKPNELEVKLLVEGLGTYEIQEQTPTHASITIGDNTYLNVFEVNVPGNDTDNPGKVKLVYFNKTQGFIRVEFYGGKFLQLQ